MTKRNLAPDQYYTSFEEIRDAFARAMRQVPGLHLNHQEIMEIAGSFANMLQSIRSYEKRAPKDLSFFQLAAKIKGITEELAELQVAEEEIFNIFRKNPNCFSSSGKTIAQKLLAVTDIYWDFPNIAAPQKAHRIKNRRGAFELLCESSGLRIVNFDLENIAKYRLYAERVAQGAIRHEHFLTASGYVRSIFLMPVPLLEGRLADCEARLARGEALPMRSAHEEVVRRQRAAKPAAKPGRPGTEWIKVPGAAVDIASKTGQQSAAARLLAMRAAQKPANG